jgi:hypothetical protein
MVGSQALTPALWIQVKTALDGWIVALFSQRIGSKVC